MINSVKSKLKGIESELESQKGSMKSTIQSNEEQENGVQFLSDDYDDLAAVPYVRSKFPSYSNY